MRLRRRRMPRVRCLAGPPRPPTQEYHCLHSLTHVRGIRPSGLQAPTQFSSTSNPAQGRSQSSPRPYCVSSLRHEHRSWSTRPCLDTSYKMRVQTIHPHLTTYVTQPDKSRQSVQCSNMPCSLDSRQFRPNQPHLPS